MELYFIHRTKKIHRLKVFNILKQQRNIGVEMWHLRQCFHFIQNDIQNGSKEKEFVMETKHNLKQIFEF